VEFLSSCRVGDNPLGRLDKPGVARRLFGSVRPSPSEDESGDEQTTADVSESSLIHVTLCWDGDGLFERTAIARRLLSQAKTRASAVVATAPAISHIQIRGGAGSG
jgi:hypothetical protein